MRIFFLAILSLFVCSCISSFTAKYGDMEVSHFRMFEDQEVTGLTFKTNSDGSVSVKVDGFTTRSTDVGIDAAIKALEAVQQ